MSHEFPREFFDANYNHKHIYARLACKFILYYVFFFFFKPDLHLLWIILFQILRTSINVIIGNQNLFSLYQTRYHQFQFLPISPSICFASKLPLVYYLLMGPWQPIETLPGIDAPLVSHGYGSCIGMQMDITIPIQIPVQIGYWCGYEIAYPVIQICECIRVKYWYRYKCF